jgi:hypothetical protein
MKSVQKRGDWRRADGEKSGKPSAQDEEKNVMLSVTSVNTWKRSRTNEMLRLSEIDSTRRIVNAGEKRSDNYVALRKRSNVSLS